MASALSRGTPSRPSGAIDATARRLSGAHDPLDPLGQGRRRRHAVDADAVLAHLSGDVAAEHDDPRLGRRIGRRSGSRPGSVPRRRTSSRSAPRRRSIIPGRNALTVRNVDVRLESMIECHSVLGDLLHRRVGAKPPAKDTRMSTGPSRRSTSSRIRSIAPASRTVGGHADRLAAARLDLRRERVDPRLIAPLTVTRTRLAASTPTRVGADPLRSSGHHRDPAGQIGVRRDLGARRGRRHQPRTCSSTSGLTGQRGGWPVERSHDLLDRATLEILLGLGRVERHVGSHQRPRVGAQGMVGGERLGLGHVERHAA